MVDRHPVFIELKRPIGLLLAALLVFGGFAVMGAEEAEARGNRVDLSLTVESIDDDEDDADMRVRRHREVTRLAAERIEMRLDAIDVKNHNVTVDEQNNIHVTVYGDHSTSAIKSTVIPPGHLEVRPVLADQSPWLDLGDELPDDVELRNEPGSFQTDRIFLFSHSPSSLRQVIDRVTLSGAALIEIFPHDDGWRTINLGEPSATQSDVDDVELRSTPSGIPFVSTTLSGTATQNLRSQASRQDSRFLAIILDGEVVALQRFSNRNFSATLDLDPPDHLRSNEARNHWAIQVAGRLAAPIPVHLIEL